MRRIWALALAALISLPAVTPVAAGDPPPAVQPGVSTEPALPAGPSPTATASPPPAPDAPSPDVTVEPTPAASTDPAPAVHPPASAAARTPRPKAPVKTVAPEVDSRGRPVAAGHYLVMLKGDADPKAVLDKHRSREGTVADRAFRHAFRGFAARLDVTQRAALL